MSFYLPQAKAFRVAIEGLVAFHQDLDGRQFETDWTLVAGIQVVPVN